MSAQPAHSPRDSTTPPPTATHSAPIGDSPSPPPSPRRIQFGALPSRHDQIPSRLPPESSRSSGEREPQWKSQTSTRDGSNSPPAPGSIQCGALPSRHDPSSDKFPPQSSWSGAVREEISKAQSSARDCPSSPSQSPTNRSEGTASKSGLGSVPDAATARRREYFSERDVESFLSSLSETRRAATPTRRRSPSPPPPQHDDEQQDLLEPPSEYGNYKSHLFIDTLSSSPEPGTGSFLTFTTRHIAYKANPHSRTFLLGLPDNKYSYAALKWALKSLLSSNDTLICLRVIPPDSSLMKSDAISDGRHRSLAPAIMKSVQDAPGFPPDLALSIVVELAHDRTAPAIQRTISVYSPSCLIVGTRGRSLSGMQGSFNLLSDSVSKYCLQNSPVPVIVVQPAGQRDRKKALRKPVPNQRLYANVIASSDDPLGLELLDETSPEQRLAITLVDREREARVAAGQIGFGMADKEDILERESARPRSRLRTTPTENGGSITPTRDMGRVTPTWDGNSDRAAIDAAQGAVSSWERRSSRERRNSRIRSRSPAAANGQATVGRPARRSSLELARSRRRDAGRRDEVDDAAEVIASGVGKTLHGKQSAGQSSGRRAGEPAGPFEGAAALN